VRANEGKTDPTTVDLGPVARFVLGRFRLEKLLAEVMRRVPPAIEAFYNVSMFVFLNLFRPAVTVEVFVFRDTDDGTQVLFRDRAGTDIGYAGTRHAPGSYLLLKESFARAIRRIVRREIGPGASVVQFYFAGALEDQHEERGHQIHMVFYVIVNGVEETQTLHWYNVRDLPSNTVTHHRPMVQMALKVHRGLVDPSVVEEYDTTLT
jgi:ADP-ribose pyrophosphatase YjhB (NUDIX family)